MLVNRFIPHSHVIPVLAYPDAPAAAAWLCEAFGFTVRLRIRGHRLQLNVGTGAVIVRELRLHEVDAQLGLGCSITVRVEDADAHCDHATRHGANVTSGPETYPYGERQYTVEDPGGHHWTFSQTVADVAPEDWDSTSENL